MSFEYSEPQVPECSGVHVDQSLFVPLGDVGDRHNIDVDAMLPGERTALATDPLHVCDSRRATDLDDVDVGSRSSQAVVFRDDKAAKAMELGWPGELRIDVAEERPPRFVEVFSRH
jgi:hypothetical protein